MNTTTKPAYDPSEDMDLDFLSDQAEPNAAEWGKMYACGDELPAEDAGPLPKDVPLILLDDCDD